jgi:hypothetical protein
MSKKTYAAICAAAVFILYIAGALFFLNLPQEAGVDAQGLEWVKYQITEVQPITAAIYGLIAVIASVVEFFGINGFPKT